MTRQDGRRFDVARLQIPEIWDWQTRHDRVVVYEMLAAISADVPGLWERGEKTCAQIAAEEGVSERTVQRWRALARQVAAGVSDVVPESRGAEELPWVELVYGPTAGPHYRLDRDELSRLPAGPFRVGDHNGRRLRVAHAGDGRPVEQPPAKSKHKFKPKARGKRAG